MLCCQQLVVPQRLESNARRRRNPLAKVVARQAPRSGRVLSLRRGNCVVANHLHSMPPAFQSPAEVRAASIAPEFLWWTEIGITTTALALTKGHKLIQRQGTLSKLPAPITSGDLLPGKGALNGRRWAGQQLLKVGRGVLVLCPWLWLVSNLRHSSSCFLSAGSGVQWRSKRIGPSSPEGVIPWGGFFCLIHPLAAGPQRQPVGDSAFSLIRFTLNPAALAHLQDLVSEPVQPWDALICSSTAGRSVVETVLRSREEALAARSGGDVSRLQASRPQLPVIPCLFPIMMLVPECNKRRARSSLGLPTLLGGALVRRLSVCTKLDPWPTYCILERVAQRLNHPLILWSVGLTMNHLRDLLKALRECCPHVHFHRLGGAEPVSEDLPSSPVRSRRCSFLGRQYPETLVLLSQKLWQRVSLGCFELKWLP